MLEWLPKNKALGLDHWSPIELYMLPEDAIADLAFILTTIEAAGTWPTNLRQCLVAMIPKEGAKAESDQRPIRAFALHVQALDVYEETSN